MKTFNKYVWIGLLLFGSSAYAQITFNACHPILENQEYTFNFKSIDVTGRNVFETDPVNGDQDCGGIGVCEMQVAWSVGNNRWEIYADDGNGTFSNTYVLYYNTEASTPNPPSLLLGTWMENTAVTASLCVDGITTWSGDVQDSTLGLTDATLADGLMIYPNPTSGLLVISSQGFTIDNVEISDLNGRIVWRNDTGNNRLDVSYFAKGMYFIKVESDMVASIKKIIIE